MVRHVYTRSPRPAATPPTPAETARRAPRRHRRRASGTGRRRSAAAGRSTAIPSRSPTRTCERSSGQTASRTRPRRPACRRQRRSSPGSSSYRRMSHAGRSAARHRRRRARRSSRRGGRGTSVLPTAEAHHHTVPVAKISVGPPGRRAASGGRPASTRPAHPHAADADRRSTPGRSTVRTPRRTAAARSPAAAGTGGAPRCRSPRSRTAGRRPGSNRWRAWFGPGLGERDPGPPVEEGVRLPREVVVEVEVDGVDRQYTTTRPSARRARPTRPAGCAADGGHGVPRGPSAILRGTFNAAY